MTHRALRTVLPLLVGLGLAACARSVPEAERQRVFLPDTSQLTWTGRTVDEVFQVFGPPSSREPNPDGGTVLTYETVETKDDRPQPKDKPGPGDPNVARDPTDDLEVRRTNAAETKAQAQFWIDAQGKVTRFEFSPEMYKKGVPSPP